MMVASDISTIHDGKDKAYLYIWYSKIYPVLYVGQTNQRLGTMGRAYEHLGFSPNGTLRKNLLNREGIDLEELIDLKLLSFLLPQKPEFISIETSYRLAVEYLVQIKLLEIRGNVNPIFRIISKTQPTERVNDKNVQDIANQIVESFLQFYR